MIYSAMTLRAARVISDKIVVFIVEQYDYPKRPLCNPEADLHVYERLYEPVPLLPYIKVLKLSVSSVLNFQRECRCSFLGM